MDVICEWYQTPISRCEKKVAFRTNRSRGRHTYRDARASGIRGKKEFVRGPPLRAPIQRALKEGTPSLSPLNNNNAVPFSASSASLLPRTLDFPPVPRRLTSQNEFGSNHDERRRRRHAEQRAEIVYLPSLKVREEATAFKSFLGKSGRD